MNVSTAITSALDADPRTADPLGGLVVWTELGKALAGALERKGADVGLLGRIIDDWSRATFAPSVDLDGWLYRVPPERRLGRADLARALARVQAAVEAVVAPLAEEVGEDGGRAVFLAVIKGWFAVGLALFAALPAARGASEAEVRGALAAWCRRYLPKDPSGPEDLGVRLARPRQATGPTRSRGTVPC